MKTINEKHCDKLVAQAKGIIQEVAAGGTPIPKVRPRIRLRKYQIEALKEIEKDDEFVRALRFLNTPGVE